MRHDARQTTASRLTHAWRWSRRLWAEIGTARIFDWAAALTYYGMLSLGPALVVLVAVLGLVGGAAALLDQMTHFAPGPARDTVTGIIRQVKGADTRSGVALLVGGLLAATWSASGYVGAFGRAARAIRGETIRA